MTVRHNAPALMESMSSSQPRSVKIAESERGGWSSERPRRPGEPERPPRKLDVSVRGRVLAPSDRLRYSPGSRILSRSLEWVRVPPRLAGAIESRSSLEGASRSGFAWPLVTGSLIVAFGLALAALLLVRRRRRHGRSLRHMRQRSHQCGQSPPLGSCRTSPPLIRSTSPTAVSRAVSIAPAKSSGSR